MCGVCMNSQYLTKRGACAALFLDLYERRVVRALSLWYTGREFCIPTLLQKKEGFDDHRRTFLCLRPCVLRVRGSCCRKGDGVGGLSLRPRRRLHLHRFDAARYARRLEHGGNEARLSRAFDASDLCDDLHDAPALGCPQDLSHRPAHAARLLLCDRHDRRRVRRRLPHHGGASRRQRVDDARCTLRLMDRRLRQYHGDSDRAAHSGDRHGGCVHRRLYRLYDLGHVPLLARHAFLVLQSLDGSGYGEAGRRIAGDRKR